MANIQCRTTKDGNKSYRVQVRLKGCPPQTATFERLTDARKWAASTESAIREGRHFKTSEAKRHTVAKMINRYCAEVLPRKRNSQRQHYQLQWWCNQIGAYLLADISPTLIAEYRDLLARTPTIQGDRQRSPSSVNRYLAALSHAFTIAVKEYGWLGDNPCREVERFKEPRGRVRYLDHDERNRLLEACKASSNLQLYDAVILALATGGREMEVLGLRWRDINLQHGTVTFLDTKNGEHRSVPVRGPALEMIRARAKVRRLDTELLFPGRNPTRPVEFRRSWETALHRAGIDDFRWHDLRHSAASYLAMSGATASEIAEILGHKTLAMVKRYSHLSPDHLAGVMDRMNASVFGESTSK